MKLSDVVPWGRSLAEYQAMFALSPEDIKKRILGCGDGPASFNAEWKALGGRAVSIDPIYGFDGAEIAIRFEQAAPIIIAQVTESMDLWNWSYHGTPEGLMKHRQRALKLFLEDFDEGKISGRYLEASLPKLTFDTASFDLALCSHFLFLYSEHLTEDFHVRSVLELCRVAKEVRIFPLLSLDKKISPHLKAVLTAISKCNLHAEIIRVDYEFQLGGNEMLVIHRS